MGRYDNEEYGGGNAMNRQRDLVLAINEFCFLQNKTNGTIKSHVGPLTMTISQQEALVTFNSKTKKFIETQDFETAKQLFVSAPEGWYVILKNPTTDGQYPEPAKANTSPQTIKIGTKVNIPGPTSFALYPGQMARTVRGHKLRSNQYLIARVYDAAAAKKGMASATVIDVDGKEVENKAEEYFVGQLLVIKGTDVSFYIPPTGIEVIPQTVGGDDYVRDAITLERLEYAILKDEDGEKRYVHGPAVVFPKPTETFIKAPKGGSIFRALELSPISGIYIKVIAAYKDETGDHPIGEELFITGNDQMIYYPRPEHAMIQYDGRYMHHAIAIPEGEGRYILDRLTGTIKTVIGPQMYLPDPRKEVVVKRKLSEKECDLFYPGNKEVKIYNMGLNEKSMERNARSGQTNPTDVINNAYSTSNQEATLAIFEANANISRGVSYTKPRTITLDTKYDGVVSIDVWTGYAINVISKGGKREVVVGPQTRVLDYEETLEAVNNGSTAFLKVENNKITDTVTVLTKDFVSVTFKVAYNIDFLKDYKVKWFTVDDYETFLCDRTRTMIKKIVKNYSVEEVYSKYTEIINEAIMGVENKGYIFKENGMKISAVDVLALRIQDSVARLMEENQSEVISQALELSNAERTNEIEKKLAEYEKENAKLKYEADIYQMELDNKLKAEKLAAKETLRETERAQAKAEKDAEKDMQEVLDFIQKSKLARDIEADNAKIETEKKLAEIEKAKQEAYADTVKTIVEAIGPDLAAALSANANADITKAISQAVSPYAMAKGESIADTTSTLLRGTPLQQMIKAVEENKVK